MDIESILTLLAIGTVAGWLAGSFMSGGGFSLLGNILIGITGAIVGGTLFTLPGLASGWVGEIVTATLGAIVLLLFARLIKKP
ncbi:MAG: GlsB/YeaQ/YmgE family stress response membrane protein [Pseudomonadota bacterium]|nr:GlsB/YeaQ/YmgE family stress response membrane protein [Pseudomonadota bacterium]